MRDLGRIGPLRSALHVRKLVAQRRDAAFGESFGGRRHEGVCHARAGTVREDVARARIGGQQEEAGNGLRIGNRDLDRLRVHRAHRAGDPNRMRLCA